MRILNRKNKEKDDVEDATQGWVIFSILCVALSIFSCAPAMHRIHPEFNERIRSLKTQGVVSCEAKMYHLYPGGVAELRDDWSMTARENLLRALSKVFHSRQYKVIPLATEEDIQSEMEAVQALYRTVNKSIRLHTYGPQLLPDKEKRFDYTIGSTERILKRFKADSMLFVDAVGEFSAGWKKVFVSIAIIDRGGFVIWYCARGSIGSHDLRDPDSAANIVEVILYTLPKVGG